MFVLFCFFFILGGENHLGRFFVARCRKNGSSGKCHMNREPGFTLNNSQLKVDGIYYC